VLAWGIVSATGCLWCHRPFRARRSGGQRQRFCRPGCRRAFHAGARAWVLDAIASGALTVADVRKGLPATRALLPAGQAAQRDYGRGALVVELRVLPNAIEDLCQLGWLDGTTRSGNAVADAVVELAERALALRLRPR
jgi:hypothetical protein